MPEKEKEKGTTFGENEDLSFLRSARYSHDPHKLK
jgi:hypothetical protein